MKHKKILFMGGKYVGYESLNFLIENKYAVTACYINKEDTVSDRWYNSIAELCFKQHIPVYYYKDVNSPQSETIIRTLSPDILLVIYYNQILKQNIIEIPSFGCINLHLGLSQIHRGCYPTTWSLIRGDEYTGITLHYITKDIDAGPAIAQRKIKIRKDWTGKDLYYKVSNLGIQMFKEIFPKLDQIESFSVDLSKAKYYKKKFPSRKIILDKQTFNKIRALIFDPFPPPYIMIGRKKYIISEKK